MPSIALERHFADYADHHRTRLNKLTHFVGIPTIALALLGLGSKLVLWRFAAGPTLDLGVALAAVLTAVYLRWHPALAIATAVLLAPLYLAGSRLPAAWLWAVLALGVGLQYLGHYVFEGRAPAFHRNAVHTLVGPLWVVASLLRALGLRVGPATAVQPPARPGSR